MEMVGKKAEAVARQLHRLQTIETKNDIIVVAFTAIIDDGLLLVDGREFERRYKGMQWWLSSSFLAHIERGDPVNVVHGGCYCNGLQVVLKNLKGAGLSTSLYCASFW